MGHGGRDEEGVGQGEWGEKFFCLDSILQRSEVLGVLRGLSAHTYIGTQLLCWNHSFVLQGLPTEQARDKKLAMMPSSPALHCVCMHALCVCVRVCVCVCVRVCMCVNPPGHILKLYESCLKVHHEVGLELLLCSC